MPAVSADISSEIRARLKQLYEIGVKTGAFGAMTFDAYVDAYKNRRLENARQLDHIRGMGKEHSHGQGHGLGHSD